MENIFCSKCGSKNDAEANFCISCGQALKAMPNERETLLNMISSSGGDREKAIEYLQKTKGLDYMKARDYLTEVTKPIEEIDEDEQKSRVTAALLAFFLGGFGAHLFYLGKNGAGWFYLALIALAVICTVEVNFFVGMAITSLAGLLAFIDFIMLLAMSDKKFNKKYN
jgi:TM2 domain-containing membrane protein YozV